MLNQKIPIKITNINNDIAEIKITDDDFNLTEKELDNKFELQFLSLEPGYRTGVRKAIPCILYQDNFKFNFRIRLKDLFHLINQFGCSPNGYINEPVYLLKQGGYYNIYDYEKIKELSKPKSQTTLTLEYGKAYKNKLDSFLYLGTLKNNKRKIFIHYYGQKHPTFLDKFKTWNNRYNFYCTLQKSKIAYEPINVNLPIPDIKNLKDELLKLKKLIEVNGYILQLNHNLNIILRDEIIP